MAGRKSKCSGCQNVIVIPNGKPPIKQAVASSDPIVCYNCGCYYAIAASLTNDKEAASGYAEKAIRFIREAGEKEFFTPAMKSHVASDKDLNPLREFESFKKLCRDFGLPLKSD